MFQKLAKLEHGNKKAIIWLSGKCRGRFNSKPRQKYAWYGSTICLDYGVKTDMLKLIFLPFSHKVLYFHSLLFLTLYF